MNTATPKHILDQIDRQRLQHRLKVKAHALSMAISRGKFPASWFPIVSEECAEAGIECPVAAFAFRDAAE